MLPSLATDSDFNLDFSLEMKEGDRKSVKLTENQKRRLGDGGRRSVMLWILETLV